MVTDKTSEFQTEKVKVSPAQKIPPVLRASLLPGVCQPRSRSQWTTSRRGCTTVWLSKKSSSANFSDSSSPEQRASRQTRVTLLCFTLPSVCFTVLCCHHSLCSVLVLTLDLWSLPAVMLLFLHCSVDMTELKHKVPGFNLETSKTDDVRQQLVGSSLNNHPRIWVFLPLRVRCLMLWSCSWLFTIRTHYTNNTYISVPVLRVTLSHFAAFTRSGVSTQGSSMVMWGLWHREHKHLYACICPLFQEFLWKAVTW